MRSEIETLLVWLVPIVALQATFQFFYGTWYANLLGSGQLQTQLINLFPSLSLGQSVLGLNIAQESIKLMSPTVVAVWLAATERKRNGRFMLWAVSALLLQFWVLVLYVGYRLSQSIMPPNNALKSDLGDAARPSAP